MRVFASQDRLVWSEYDVDYRASGHKAMLASAGGKVFIATDGGLILTLDPK